MTSLSFLWKKNNGMLKHGVPEVDDQTYVDGEVGGNLKIKII